MLNIEMEKADGVLNIALKGRLNSMTSKEFSQQLESELEGVRSVVLDFADLDYISSAGLRILLALQQRMEAVEGEDVRVRNANQTITDTLEMTGFQGIINIE